MDVCQWCNISKFSKFYAFLIPYSYIMLPCYQSIVIWSGSSSMLQQLQHVFLAGTIDTSDQDNVPQHAPSIRYMHVNQHEFLDNSGEKKNWGKISCSGKKTLNFKMQVHIMPREKNLLVIIKQLQSKPYQGRFCQPNTSCPQSRWHWCHDKLQHNNNLSGTGFVPDHYFSMGSTFYRVFQKTTTQHVSTHLLSFSNQK